MAQLYSRTKESNFIYILSNILASIDNYIRISLHYYIEEQIKVIVYTFYQLYILQGLIFAS